jgi:hypothetical protein
LEVFRKAERKGQLGIVQACLSRRIILKLVFNTSVTEDVDWIYLVQDRAQCRDFVENVINMHVLYRFGNLLTS